MRKWMRDRLKRRKQKTQAEAPSPATGQEPLQPTYYEATEPEAAGPPSATDTATTEDQLESASAPPAGDFDRPESEPGQASTPAQDRTRRRRRRGRGGRGRTSAQPPAPLQPTLMREQEPAAAQRSETPAPAPAEPRPATAQKPKGVVVLAIGLPGSGKSSWFKRHNIHPLSSDLLRELLFDDPAEQRFQDLVFSNLRSMLKARLIARRPMNYVDATNLSPHERHSWIRMAHDFGYEVQAVFFDVPLEVCAERNQRRQRVVADDVMQRMAGKLRPPKFEEGFSKITVVRVKKKD